MQPISAMPYHAEESDNKGNIPNEVEVLDSKPAAKRSRDAEEVADDDEQSGRKMRCTKRTSWADHFDRLEEVATSRNGKCGARLGTCKCCMQAMNPHTRTNLQAKTMALTFRNRVSTIKEIALTTNNCSAHLRSCLFAPPHIRDEFALPAKKGSVPSASGVSALCLLQLQDTPISKAAAGRKPLAQGSITKYAVRQGFSKDEVPELEQKVMNMIVDCHLPFEF